MIKKLISLLPVLGLMLSCSNEAYEPIRYDNPVLKFQIPEGFPEFNRAVATNKPTLYGVALGKKLFHDTRLSKDNTISCASCHLQGAAFTDRQAQAVGIHGRIGLRNTPPIQNLAFMKFYNWDGNKLSLENQVLVPIITKEEMDSSILEVIEKIQEDVSYKELVQKTFGDTELTPDRIYRSIAQYEYTLVSAMSKYDQVKRREGVSFTNLEESGYRVFQQKCISCHDTELFTDQSFRNVGFPLNTSQEEAGRARVTGKMDDYMRFRVPSLRNIEYTAPYGSFGQFETLEAVLDYFDSGVLDSENLDPILKENNNRIPLTVQEKKALIAFMNTLSDPDFIKE